MLTVLCLCVIVVCVTCLVLIARFCIEVGSGWWFGGDLD